MGEDEKTIPGRMRMVFTAPVVAIICILLLTITGIFAVGSSPKRVTFRRMVDCEYVNDDFVSRVNANGRRVVWIKYGMDEPDDCYVEWLE